MYQLNPLIGFQVNRVEIKFIGKDLQRPECILTQPNGTVWSADARGGLMKINPNGSQKLIVPPTLSTIHYPLK